MIPGFQEGVDLTAHRRDVEDLASLLFPHIGQHQLCQPGCRVHGIALLDQGFSRWLAHPGESAGDQYNLSVLTNFQSNLNVFDRIVFKLEQARHSEYR